MVIKNKFGNILMQLVILFFAFCDVEDKILLLTICSIASITIYILFIVKRNNGINIVDIKLTFPLVYFFYSFIYLILTGWGLMNNFLLIIDPKIIVAAGKLNITTLIILLSLLTLTYKPIKLSIIYEKYKKNIFRITKYSKYLVFLDIPFVALGLRRFFLVVVNFGLLPSLSRNKKVELISSGILLDMFLLAAMIYFVIYCINAHKRNFIYVYRFWMLALYIFSIFAVGSRREVVYLLLTYMIIYFLKTKTDKIKKRAILPIILVIAIFMSISYLRDIPQDNDLFLRKERIYLQIFGEMILPQQTLYYYMDNLKKPQLGVTYVRIFGYLIPKSLYPNKPGSLAQQAVKEMDLGDIGYAYTPMTESYINFAGFAGVFLGVFLFVLVYFSSYLVKRGYVIAYVLIYMQILNFNRGEFSNTVLEILIYATIINLYVFIAQGGEKNGKLLFFSNANNK